MSLKIKLWFSLTAALPFSSDGQHPVFSWTTSVACGHFLGQLFRHLVRGDDHLENEADVTLQQESQAHSESESSVTPRCRSQKRLMKKRQKYLRNSTSRQQSSMSSTARYSRENKRDQKKEELSTQGVECETVLDKASTTLSVIWSDYLSSAKYKKVKL